MLTKSRGVLINYFPVLVNNGWLKTQVRGKLVMFNRAAGSSLQGMLRPESTKLYSEYRVLDDILQYGTNIRCHIGIILVIKYKYCYTHKT